MICFKMVLHERVDQPTVAFENVFKWFIFFKILDFWNSQSAADLGFESWQRKDSREHGFKTPKCDTFRLECDKKVLFIFCSVYKYISKKFRYK